MMPTMANAVISLSGGCDPAVSANAQRITAELCREETKFGSTLEAGDYLLLWLVTSPSTC